MASLSGAKLLGLCTIAVGAIYAAGYVYTEPTAQAAVPSASAHQLTPQANQGASPRSSPSTSPTSSSPTPSPGAKNSGASTTAQTVQYKDGQYTGSGSNPYGTLSVLVTIANGKISNVKITSYNMHYPQQYIDPQMVNEVVSMQTWRVYVVSGATASSYNFAEAVYYALQKARA
ncbi:FMN-binding protein [Sulfobacillus harzensis]|uniref:FMN-binding protein n=1 Tax=Sulfobacillus harzensis TaxID=2729629 RepID=A0A7Y0Q245_9FIRM|nr:FMN-binding protein [Sulfobacillus harzensis]NMP22097.1 FMN-binding protein [Sulfobacillus harzensis]